MVTAVDLRAAHDQVYHQSASNACTAHALTNALEAMYENAGQVKRFSRAWIWWWSRVNSGRAGQDVGAVFADLRFAMEQKGVVLESEHPWNGSAFNPPPSGLQASTARISFRGVAPDVDTIKRRLCLGVPTVIGMELSTDWWSLYGQKNWRTNSYNVNAPDAGIRHAMCIVGFDDSVERFLIENSVGPSFADGGFFGLPYEHLNSRISAECSGVDRIYGFHPKKAEDFVAIPYLLNGGDYVNFLAKNKPRFKAMLDTALNTQGVQAVIDIASEWFITDKLIENMFLWDRGAVRLFQEQNPDLDWSKFPWAEL